VAPQHGQAPTSTSKGADPTGSPLQRVRRVASRADVDSAPGRVERTRSRARIPEHALSESDRLMARPADALATSRIRSATQGWRNWHRTSLTAHDGQFGADHPVVRQALARTQSATSLRLLLRGPLGFVWRYNAALGQISRFVELACAMLARGIALPGRDAETEANHARIAGLLAPERPGLRAGRRPAVVLLGRTMNGLRALSLISLGLIAAGVKRELADHKPSCHFGGRTRPSAR
jgi:hypothetical protein